MAVVVAAEEEEEEEGAVVASTATTTTRTTGSHLLTTSSHAHLRLKQVPTAKLTHMQPVSINNSGLSSRTLSDDASDH